MGESRSGEHPLPCPSRDPRVQQQASHQPILLTCIVISVASVTQPSDHVGKGLAAISDMVLK